jgi:Tfp pilus assembly protein PilO
MKQSSKRLVSAAMGLVFIIGAFVIFFNFIQPAYGEVGRLRSEEHQLQELATQQRQVTEQIQKLLASYESEESARRGLSLALPTTPNIADAVGQLNGLITTNGLVAQTFSLGSDAEPARSPGRLTKPTSTLATKPIRAVLIKLRAAGAYDDAKKFLEHVETNIRIMDVKELTIQPDAKDPLQYALDLTVAVYNQKEQ